MKFKDWVLTKSEKEMGLEGDAILLHIILRLCDEFQDESIKPDFENLIIEKIKYVGEKDVESSTEEKKDD